MQPMTSILRTVASLTRSTTGKRKRNIPGFHLSLCITLSMLSIFILIPLMSVLSYAFRMSPSEILSVIMEKNVLNAFVTSILYAFLAAVINCFFGLLLAWVLVRYEFPGKNIVDGLIELPFALPTAVAGITLSKMYSTTGEIGGPLSKIGIYVSYTHLGLLVALIFVGIPFVVRAIEPVLESLSPVYEEAASVMGASRHKIFFRIIFPELSPALLTGLGLAFARGIGEYGSVIYISGNSAKNKTQVISYVIMQKLGYLDYESATSIALVMLIISFILLMFLNLMQIWQSKRTSGSVANTMYVPRRLKDPRRLSYPLVVLSLIFVLTMLVFPLISVIRNALSKGFSFYIKSLSTDYVVSALLVTILATVIALICNTIFGIFASWLITRFSFRGKHLLTTLIDIPFSVSPVIAGLSYIMTFGRLGWAHPIIDSINRTLGTNIQIVFALPGVVLATIFVTFPFVSREIIPVLYACGTDEEEAAAMMGASGFQIWRKITLPHMKWALIYGMILCAARALGEFGAVNALSKTRGKTFTLPLEIDALYLSGSSDSITAAFAVSSILVIIAVVVLILREAMELREKRR